MGAPPDPRYPAYRGGDAANHPERGRVEEREKILMSAAMPQIRL
jgi:hypothetical protein